MARWNQMARDWDRGLDSARFDRLREDTGSVLFARTMLCLVTLLGITGLTSWLSWDLVLQGAIGWVLFALVFILMFVTVFVAKDNNPGAMIPASLFAAVWGVLLGPTLAAYVEHLGAGTVTGAVALTTGIMAVCGAVASLFTIPYRKIEGPLLLVLFGMVIYGCVTAFTGIPSQSIDLGYSILGAVVFTIYFLVDFARVYADARRNITGWGRATLHAVSLFLDYLNLLLFILRALGNSKD